MATKTPEERIVELGLDTELPPSVKSVAVYKPVVIIGNLAYTSGQIPRDAKGQLWKGKVGQEVTVESGYQSARLCVRALHFPHTLPISILDRKQDKGAVCMLYLRTWTWP